jgi:hypothetical protein
MATVNRIATHGVLREGCTTANTGGTTRSRAMPYTRRDAMIIFINAVLLTASSAIMANSLGGNARPATLTTSSSGPEDVVRVRVSTSIVAVKATAA